jgi:hypothetical protein
MRPALVPSLETLETRLFLDVSPVVVSGTETPTGELRQAAVTGSGTTAMTIALDAGLAVDTWVKVILKGSAGVPVDAAGRLLDGEPKSGRRVLLGAAKDNNGGNRQPGWNTEHGHKGKGGTRDRDGERRGRAAFSRPPRRTRVVRRGQRQRRAESSRPGPSKSRLG